MLSRHGCRFVTRFSSFLAIAVLLACRLALAQPGDMPLRFEQLNVEQGLPQESALALAQDGKGVGAR